MKGNSIYLKLIFFSLFLFLGESRLSLNNNHDINHSSNDSQIYIVYMGAANPTIGSLRKDHAQVLNTVLRRNKKALVHNYKYGFSGFAARLSKDEADSIAQKSGVVSVFPNPTLKLHTTHSWDFIKSQTHVNIKSQTHAKINNMVSNSSFSSDVIIGMLDSGIWPESASFSDKGMGPIPSRWKGVCMTSNDFNSSNCNRKIIGARCYPDDKELPGLDTVRDAVGHGTHTASTTAGAAVSGASLYGLAAGTAKGGSPESRLAIYKVCSYDWCSGAAILAGFDHAVHDGVDVLSVSLGGDANPEPDLTTDVLAIGAFHAAERGILVVCSAGNAGPNSYSVTNDAPWIFTVGATTIDRDIQTNVLLGNNKVVKGVSMCFHNLSKSPKYPLITGESAKKASAKLAEARGCHDNSLDKKKVKGKIVICDGTDYPVDFIIQTVQKAGGVGVIHIFDEFGAVAFLFSFPITTVTSKDAVPILQYVNSTSNPMATILPTAAVMNYKPAPIVISFSSRGPSYLTRNIIKPDIAAPGVNILAAWIGNDVENAPKGKQPPQYMIESGTSMSCPHVAGLAASIKSKNPTWSISAIRSAIMTTATQIDNTKASMTVEFGTVATPYDAGAGEITTESYQPGLVYQTSTTDYLNFLCYLGYNTTRIKRISLTAPKNFSCPKDSTPEKVSNINYPSIAISVSTGKETVNVSRTVTNVGEEDETIYSAIVDAPNGVKVQLIPEKLEFTKGSKKLSYQVIFSCSLTSLKDDLDGSITWSNGIHSVRSPFVISVSK